jgi:hypothetical protein
MSIQSYSRSTKMKEIFQNTNRGIAQYHWKKTPHIHDSDYSHYRSNSLSNRKSG